MQGHWLNWRTTRLLTAALAGGFLFQTGCTEVWASLSAGLASSMANSVITNLVNEWLGVSGSSFLQFM